MSTFLVDHALANVWSTPEQDRQYIFRPAKLSTANGSIKQISIVNTPTTLPTANDFYYVYQIGAIGTDLINIMENVNVWTPVSRVMRECNLVIDLYDNNGLQYPRFATYILVSVHGAVIVAVKKLAKLTPNLETESLYIRFYSNAYFNSIRNTVDNRTDRIYTYGRVIASTADILDMQATLNAHSNLPGHVYGFINGYYASVITVQNTAIGDVAEFIYDSTIKKILDFSVSNLDSFDSTLDLKRKYLLHDASFTTDSIEYQDDIDCYIYKPQQQGIKKGLMFHKNQPSAFRNVTHKDYSIAISYLQNYVVSSALWDDITQVRIALFVRHSGWHRPLVNEANRIKELYKLNDTNLREVMLGVDSNIDNWKADSLENSFYCKVMRNYSQFIDTQMVESAYGYNAISKLAADTPQVPVNDLITLPYLLQRNSTIYEFDVTGKLLESNPHAQGITYIKHNAATKLIQAVTGVGGLDSGSVFNVDNYPIVKGREYRFYKALKNLDSYAQTWVDITDSFDYSIDNGVLTWQISLLVWDVQIRHDGKFIDYDISLPATDLLYQFDINASATVGGSVENRPIIVPYGELDIWFNGNHLAYGIDYYVKWPTVTIVNRQYSGSVAKFHVRARGFCGTDLLFVDSSEIGWVTAGLLSHNQRFDIRDDRVMQVSASGKMLLPTTVQYGESGSITALSGLNNRPYAIRDIRVGLGEIIVGNTDTLRAASRAVDSVISDYLTIKIPEVIVTNPSIGVSKYQLYSPFLAKIIYDIKNNNVATNMLDPSLSESQLRGYCTAYLPLLESDPCLLTAVNAPPIVIAPFPTTAIITMPYNARYMLTRLVRMYLNDRVDLTPYITITNA